MSMLKLDIHGLGAGFPFGPEVPDETVWLKTEKYFPHCRPCVQKRVADLSALLANWDGYGAQPFASTLIDAVRAFLGRLPDELFIRPYKETDCLLPAVVPMSSGAIQLEWHVAERILELEFETPEQIHYLKWWPQRQVEEEGVYLVADGRQSSRLIEWVLHGYDPE